MARNRIRVGATMFAAIGVLAGGSGLIAGCSAATGGQAQTAPVEDNGLAGCGPLADAKIEKFAGVTRLHRQASPTICEWTAVSNTGGTVDITYGWLRKNSLMMDRQTAIDLGYTTENLVVKSFGGFYWRDPQDPGVCGVSAADSGTVSWWIHNRDHAAQPDPCAAAFQLMLGTVQLDG
ncbi:DUF3558 domain-containing protein [Nocardia sp. NPDC051030]|uniref:DUF3558 domain-containing protein n=1 Tax=Nocardia sp. NPDC051030 TaxID=3155162 RepID=UPI00341462EF